MTAKKTALLICIASLAACQADTSSPSDIAAQTQCLMALPAPVSIQSSLAIIGSERAYREEAPKRQVQLSAFEIDAAEVTNAAFKEFVDATNYVTDAEKKQAGFDTPGGAVFKAPSASNPSWWQFIEGANWRSPEGPDSSIEGRGFDPVVQVSLRDAKAYAQWSERRLPTQEEWEHAAKGGSEDLYVWGEEKAPGGIEQANTWQGAFPVSNSAEDGHLRRAPVGCYPANGYGLYDMIGNVWEWTDTAYPNRSETVQYVIKGGSFLCSPNYCRRYRASALQPQDADFTTNHIGFRTVKDLIE